ncbi:MAG TPA: M20/M25/M40 family metallo-hydrolase [Polyangiaceae bacterium]|jgi:glutamate carboxypeptidase|nr:M20/M25/M40 family metallo-hydrolase [Polyangiaceae bacterium]
MRTHADEATAWLSDKQRAMEQALALLVSVNSFTENPEGGRQTGTLLAHLFEMPGVISTARPSERFADHWVFRSRVELPNKTAVALVGHLDTVFPPGAFEGYRQDGTHAFGPGVLDMKGGLVVIAFAMRALAETGGLDAVVPLRVVVVSDEEVGSPEGSGVISAAITGSSACLVFEAGRFADAIITRRKGTGSLVVVAHGRAAHAGNALADGANAIWALARFIDGAQRLTDMPRGVSVNVGRIVGGHSKNTVPDRAEAHVDIRFSTRADGDRLVAALRRTADEAVREVPGTRFELQGGIARLPLERTEASVALLAAYASCARTHGLGADEAGLVGGGSDASTAAALGIPAIDGLGPRGTGFHTTDERIELASLVPKAQALARFLAERSAG